MRITKACDKPRWYPYRGLEVPQESWNTMTNQVIQCYIKKLKDPKQIDRLYLDYDYKTNEIVKD